MNALPATADTLGPAALKLFREGRDTADVAQMLGISEALASRLIWIARCRAKNLPAEWLGRSGKVLSIASASVPKKKRIPSRARPLPCAAADQPRRDGACPPSTPPSGAPLSHQQEHHHAA